MLESVEEEIGRRATEGRIAAAMAAEGYAGGYRDAISDVLLILEGASPCSSRGRDYWSRIGGDAR